MSPAAPAHHNAGVLGVKQEGPLLGREAQRPAAGVHQGPWRAAPYKDAALMTNDEIRMTIEFRRMKSEPPVESLWVERRASVSSFGFRI